MSTTPGSTAQALAQMRALASGIDHASRRGLDAHARLALVHEAVALGRQVEALRALLVAEADRAKAAETARGAGITTLLAVSPTVTPGEAAGWAHAGRGLAARPRVRAAALAGEVSVAQARSIDQVMGELPATLTDDQRDHAVTVLLDQAARVDARGLARSTREVLQQVAPEVDAVEDELSRLDAQRRRAHAARALSILPDGRGSMLLRGQLPLLEGEMFRRIVDAHTTANRRARERAADRHDDPLRTPAQRLADGLIGWVMATDAAGRGGGASADGSMDAGAGAGGIAGGPAAARPTLVVTMSHDALLHGVEQAGRLVDGTTLSAGDLRRLACDAAVIPVVLGGASEPLDVGRAHRLVTPPIRRALEVRDGGCAFPGCQVPARACEAHHVTPWYLGGRTSASNLVLLCPHHHGTVEPLRFFSGATPPSRWQVRMDADGHPTFTPPAQPGAAARLEVLRHQRRSESTGATPRPP